MQDRKPDIHKAAGILIKDKKLLVTLERRKEFFIAPGGKLNKGESSPEALIRELHEELDVDTNESDLEIFDTFWAEAAGQEGKLLCMDVYMVKDWIGEPVASSEVEEIRWITSKNEENLKLGSIFEKHVIPRLLNGGLIS